MAKQPGGTWHQVSGSGVEDVQLLLHAQRAVNRHAMKLGVHCFKRVTAGAMVVTSVFSLVEGTGRSLHHIDPISPRSGSVLGRSA
jgi:hypothetical protein